MTGISQGSRKWKHFRFFFGFDLSRFFSFVIFVKALSVSLSRSKEDHGCYLGLNLPFIFQDFLLMELPWYVINVTKKFWGSLPTLPNEAKNVDKSEQIVKTQSKVVSVIEMTLVCVLCTMWVVFWAIIQQCNQSNLLCSPLYWQTREKRSATATMHVMRKKVFLHLSSRKTTPWRLHDFLISCIARIRKCKYIPTYVVWGWRKILQLDCRCYYQEEKIQ